jgi:hypothetical protein
VSRVRIVHWKPAEAGPLVDLCRACGFDVEYNDVEFPALARLVRQNPPDALVIDLTCRPSHGRGTAVALRRTKYARHIPLIFVDGEPEKVDEVRKLLPDATFATRKQLCGRIKSACSKAVVVPVIPPDPMKRYASRTVAEKLGIKEGATVALVDPPRDYAAAIGELPADVELVEDPDSVHGLTLWFVSDSRVYQAGLRRMRALADRTRLWVVWRKGAKDITQYVVRQAANDVGLVDYKICAMNEKWSAMALAPRKS